MDPQKLWKWKHEQYVLKMLTLDGDAAFGRLSLASTM